LKQAAIPVSTLLAGLAVPLVALTVGWRFAYLAAALFAIGVVVVTPRPEIRGKVNSSRGAERPGFHYIPLFVLALGMACGAGAANSLGAFMVGAGVHVGLSASFAGYLAAAGSAASLVTRIVSGYLADRRSGGHFLVAAGMLGAGAVAYLLLSLGDRGLTVVAAVFAYAAGWGWNGLYNYAVIRLHPDAPARATGITQSGAYLGSVLGPFTFGVIVDHLGFASAWRYASLLAVAGVFLIVQGRWLLLKRLSATPPPIH
ncbi:MAG: MFS transporter, partial [Acidimicrobiales bacterium]